METITNPTNQNIELGKVTWLRDYHEALNKSKVTQKPVLLFFQKIPGCSTCVNYGRDVLSHPLMVEFIENEFVPLAIYNNIEGKDREILNLYNEPTWNNPVSHFINADGKDIIPKLANNYHPLSLYYKLVETLLTLKKDMPSYALLLEEDLKIKYNGYVQIIIETPCFCSGETTMAQHPAVKYTEAGWIGNKEVVKLFYDTDVAPLNELNAFAKKEGFYLVDNHEAYRIDKDPQYYISRSNYKYLPLSKRQRTLINVMIPYKGNPSQFLSPKQLEIINTIEANSTENNPKNYTSDIEQTWNY